MSQETQVLMIGCGKMGGALLSQWLEQPGYSFTVVTPSGRPLPEQVESVRSAAALDSRQFDLIIIAVKPQMFPDVLPDYRELLAKDGCFVSIAAGFSTASIEALIGEQPLVRVMPNLPVQIGKGVSSLFANSYAASAQREAVDQLMATTGTLVWVDAEDEVDRLTAIAGSGPGYVFEIARCWMKASQALGLSEAQARDVVLQTLAGSVELALQSDTPLGELRDGVTSKNGTTAAGLSALNRDAKLDGLMQATVDAAYARAVELR